MIPLQKTSKSISMHSVLPVIGYMASLRQEHFVVLTFDSKGSFINKHTVFIGSVNAVIVHPREVFACALEDRATSIVVAHNHPSGDPEPSKADRAMTQQLSNAGKVMNIRLEGHIIIGSRGHHFIEGEGGS